MKKNRKEVHRGYKGWTKPKNQLDLESRNCPWTMESFIKVYEGWVTNQIRKFGVNNEQDVEDLRQEIYIRMIERRPIEKWDGAGPAIKTYVFPVIRSIVYNFKNKQTKRIVTVEKLAHASKAKLKEMILNRDVDPKRCDIYFDKEKRLWTCDNVPVYYKEVDLTFTDAKGNEYVHPEVEAVYVTEADTETPIGILFFDRFFTELKKKAPWTSSSHRGESTKSMTMVVEMLMDDWTPTEISRYFKVAPQTFTIWRRYLKKIAAKVGIEDTRK